MTVPLARSNWNRRSLPLARYAMKLGAMVVSAWGLPAQEPMPIAPPVAAKPVVAPAGPFAALAAKEP